MCMNMYLQYITIHIYMHIFTFMYTQAHACMCISILLAHSSIYLFLSLHFSHTYTHVLVDMCKHVRVLTDVYVCVFLSLHLSMFVSVSMHTNHLRKNNMEIEAQSLNAITILSASYGT